MNKWMTMGLALMLLSPMAAQARHHKASASPTPAPAASSTPQVSDKHSLQMTATLLSSFETKNTDGDPERDDIVLIDDLADGDRGAVRLSIHSFMLKDTHTGRTYSALTTNNSDINQSTTLSARDGALGSMKVYFTVPGDVRPDKLYVQVGDTMEAYPLLH